LEGLVQSKTKPILAKAIERNGVETSRLPDHQMDRSELAAFFRSTLSPERGAAWCANEVGELQHAAAGKRRNTKPPGH
jgi:hypothetical protein